MDRKRQKVYTIFIVLAAPAVLLRILTAVYPMFRTTYLSMTDLHLVEGTRSFIGSENYRQLLQDNDFFYILGFSLVFVLVSTLLELCLGLLIALLLNAKFSGRYLARTITLLPWAIPTIVAALAFQWLLDDQFGLFSHWIHYCTGQRPALLNSAFGARICLICVNVWKNTPFVAIICLAGLQGIPAELHEAAKMDGAGAWQRLYKITLPMITPLLVTMGMYLIIWQLASFDLVFGLTRGGPGIATTVVSLDILQEGLFFFKFGYASAISVLLMILVACIGLVGILWFRRIDY
jgi:multiple sugar transport system permease protein